MKSLPDVRISIEPLMLMLYGAMPRKLLLTGIELRVFSHLTEATSSKSLARELRTRPQGTRSLLDGLAVNGMLHKRNGRYTNSPFTPRIAITC